MFNPVIFDMTTFEDAYNSLSQLTGIYPEELLKYIYLHDIDTDPSELFTYFNLDEQKIMDREIFLASWHVTTNDDECESIKKYGLRNLQEAIKLDTTLSRFLKELGVNINIDDKKLFYQDKTYDLSKDYKGFYLTDEEEKISSVRRKIYKDHQINGFFYSEDPLDYDGDVNIRPEILQNIAQLINFDEIEMNKKWGKRTQCFVIKFIAHLDKYEDYTFKDSDYEGESDNSYKVRWVIKKCLNILFNYANGHTTSDIYSYLKSDVIIPYEDMEIFIADNEMGKRGLLFK